MLQPDQIAELDRIASEIKNIDHALGSGLLIPLGTKVNSSRAALVFQQTGQSKNLEHPHIARVSTGYEKVFGDRSTSYHKSDREYEVVEKIQKFGNDSVYALVLKEIGKNYYDIVLRNEVESFAESSGVMMNNIVIDSKKIGDSVKSDEILFKSRSYDESMNYRLGINARTIYMTDPAIVEDGFKSSDTLAEKLRATEVETFKIPKNTNDIFLNLYGTSEEYKTFPDIGEKVKNKVLCGRRRIDYNNAQYMLKSKNLRKEMFGDTLYYTQGTVIDIDIYSNIPIDEVPTDKVNQQTLKYMKMGAKYWHELRKILGRIVDNPDNDYSDQVGITYARAKDVLSINKHTKWDDDGSIFDNMIIFITVVNSKKAVIGTKLVGRHGNKGVISEIIPEKYMPRSEDGVYAEIIFSALSVIGRLNPSQLYELELNWIVDEILAGDVSNKKKFETLMDFLSICNPNQEKLVKDLYESLGKSEKEEFIDQVTKDFVTFQPPSMSISFKNYAKLVDKIEPKKKSFTVMDEKGTVFNIQRKLIMSDSYIYRLKHEPITKFSVRSKGTINPRTFLPIKSHAYSRGTALFNNQAIRIGNMEMDILNLCNDPAAINYFTRLYCTSVTGRREFAQLLDINIFSEEVQIEMPNPKSRVVDLFNSTFMVCGMGLRFNYGKQKKIEENILLEELKNMDNKHIKVFFAGWDKLGV
jgi:DNA-directed RNA polymerase beta subunit